MQINTSARRLVLIVAATSAMLAPAASALAQNYQSYDARRAQYEQSQREYEAQRAQYEHDRAEYDRRYGPGAYDRYLRDHPGYRGQGYSRDRFERDNSRQAYDADGSLRRDGYRGDGRDRDGDRYDSDGRRCAEAKSNNQLAGGILGALAGAAIGSNVAKGGGRTGGAIIGGVAGAAVGSSIAKGETKCD